MEIRNQRIKVIAVLLLLTGCDFIHEKVDTQAEDGTRIVYTKELGVKEGLYQHFHKNGQVRFEVQFVDGNEEGEGKFYDDRGRLEMVELYKEGTVISSTEYHENGTVKLNTGRKDKLRHGALFQMTDKSDTIVVAYFELDTTKYIKAYDASKEEALDYYLDYRLGFAARGQDSVLIKLMHRSPDPKVEWKFALGEFSDEEIDNYEYEDDFVNLTMEAYDLGSFVMHRSNLVGGRVRGLIVEYDKDYVFHTPVDEKIE